MKNENYLSASALARRADVPLSKFKKLKLAGVVTPHMKIGVIECYAASDIQKIQAANRPKVTRLVQPSQELATL